MARKPWDRILYRICMYNSCISKAYPCLLFSRRSHFKRFWMEEGGRSQLKGVFRSVWRGRWEHGRGLRTTLKYDGGGWWFIPASITFLLLLYTNEVESITLTPDQRNKPHTHNNYHPIIRTCPFCAPVRGSQAPFPLSLPSVSVQWKSM